MKQTIGYVAALVIAASIASPAYGADANATTTFENVVVTGSRIKRDASFESPVPTVTVDTDAINSNGLTVLGDALFNFPQVLGSANAQVNTGSLFDGGQSRVNLRGLGSTRTLVLVDGRRHLAGDFRVPAVDLNMFPSSMIESVEMISGGASAVYGSEAIAGVVNIKLRDRLDGATVDFQGGISQEGDGEEWKAAVGYGMPFADGRGSFVIGGEWGKVEAIHVVDRDWAFPGKRRNSTVLPQTVIPATRNTFMPTATFQLFGGNNAATARSVSIALDRSTLHVNSAACRTATVSAFCQDPWLVYTNIYGFLQVPSDRQVARAYVDFELTDGLVAFGDFSYSHIDGSVSNTPPFSSAAGGGTMPIFIRGDNAYLNGSSPLATQLRNEWTAAGRTLVRATTVNVGKYYVEFGRRDGDITRENFRAVSGLRGDFSLWNRDMSWEAYAQYGELDGRVDAYNVVNISRLQQAVDAVPVGGQIVCSDLAARAAGCVPWDLINGPSADAVAWSNASARFDGLASQTVIAANVESAVVELPAGSMRIAVGAEYRDEESDFRQDALSATPGATFYNRIGTTKGQYHISEAYVETVAPLLKDLPFVYRWSIEAAGRLGDYSTAGSVDQWRFQTTWAPIEDVSFRASRAKAVRAPNIVDLFSPQSRNFNSSALDPCDMVQIAAIASDPARQARRIANCAATIPNYNPSTFDSNIGSGEPSTPILQGGNADLFEESADTLSIGMVIKPRWLDNFSVSLDYWRIEIDDAIGTIPINSLMSTLCYDDPQAPASNRFCQLIRRDASGATTGREGGVIEVILTNQNVQLMKTAGIDLAVQYDQDFGAAGLFQFRADATKYKYRDLQGFAGGPVTYLAGAITSINAIPNYKANGTFGWTREKLGIQWQTRFQSSYASGETELPSSRDPFYTGNYFEHDLRGSYRWSDALTLRAGIVNVTNEEPPALPEIGAAIGDGSSTFDSRGRWFYAGVKYGFASAR